MNRIRNFEYLQHAIVSTATNFTFAVIGETPSPSAINKINCINSISKISDRINAIYANGWSVEFRDVDNQMFKSNLILIDSLLHRILAYIIYYKYKMDISQISELIKVIQNENPLNFNLSKGYPFYELKVKAFLTACALGMTPELVWTGEHYPVGEIAIVKKSGDLACYNMYSKNEFQDYLVNNTMLDQPSTSEDKDNPGNINFSSSKKYRYGWLYEEDGSFFIKLNLQVRFC